MYFQTLSPQQANPLGYGMQQGAQIAQSWMDTRNRALQNQMLNAQMPYAGQMAQADLGLKQAQVPYMESQTALNQATLPYMGYKFMAPMMMAQARMAQVGISNSNAFRQWTQTPEGAQYVAQNPQMAQTIANAMQNSAGMINGNYSNPASYPTLPGTTPGMQGAPITPDQVNQLRSMVQPSIPLGSIQDTAALQAMKKSTDASARQKNLYATNIEKTMDQIDPDALTQYAGTLGTAQRYGQMALASTGNESQNYDNYIKSLNAANLMATQVRQFYGDSIQPSMIQRLESLTSPSTWANNPALAKAQFEQTKQILSQEMGTYRQAMKGAGVYQGQTGQSGAQSSLPIPSASKVLNGVTYHKINGQWYAQ